MQMPAPWQAGQGSAKAIPGGLIGRPEFFAGFFRKFLHFAVQFPQNAKATAFFAYFGYDL